MNKSRKKALRARSGAKIELTGNIRNAGKYAPEFIRMWNLFLQCEAIQRRPGHTLVILCLFNLGPV